MASITYDQDNLPVAPIKDPDSIIDYGFDWTSWLDSANSETILTSDWILESGLTEVSKAIAGDVTTVFLSGGEVGYTYRATNRITSSGGRTEDRSMFIPVKEK